MIFGHRSEVNREEGILFDGVGKYINMTLIPSFRS